MRQHPKPLSLALVALVFAVDMNLSLGVASAVPYTFAVLIALTAKPRGFGPAVALLCGVLTFAKLGLSSERGSTELWKVIANRCLALFAITVTTILGILRQRAEERLREREADLARIGRQTMLGQMATALAHELNQPLAAICLHADLAMLSEDERPAALAEIATQSQRAAAIVKGIRRMARADTSRETFAPAEAIDAVLRLIDWQVQRKHISLERVRRDEPLPDLRGDRVQLEQVLFNLLQNAIDAVENHVPKKVLLTSEIEGSTVVVSVADSGLGVVEPAKLFERFHTTKADGLGLGLAICREIAAAHDGTLTHRRSEGMTVFRLSLPGELA